MPNKLLQSLYPTNSDEKIALVGIIGIAVAVVSMLIWHYAFRTPWLAVPVIAGVAVAVWAIWKVRKVGGTITRFLSKTK